MITPTTASQTVGPFFHLGMNYLERRTLVTEGVAGRRVTIRGMVLDGDGEPVADAVLEIWQADSAGRYPTEFYLQNSAVSHFLGFGRIETDAHGEFSFTTLRPGPVLFLGGVLQAPHIVVTLFFRGLLKPLRTRVYFPDEPGNAEDPILKVVPARRRSTLIATGSSTATPKPCWIGIS